MKIPKILKALALVLIFALLLQVMPMSAFVSLAEELSDGYISEPDAAEFISDAEEEPVENAYIMFEDENKRELSSKQFRMSDGSFMAVSYPEQVHFIGNDGKFEDIDNRLVYSEAKEENDFSGFSNKANSFYIKFNETLLAENAVIYKLTKGDYTLSLERIQGENSYISNANATVTQAKDDAKPFEKEGDAAGELAFVSSKISYSNEENNVDFDYVLIGNRINEYIVIKEKLDNYTFTYRINAEGLTAEKDENEGIVFTDANGEIIYSIPAPFMYDNYGACSDVVNYEIAEEDGAYMLTVQADEEWINEEERAFPVTIDPDLYVGEYNVENPIIEDADVWQGSPTAHSGGYEYMTVGYSNFANEQEMRALVKLNNLPEIPNAAIIVDARLNLKQLVQFLHPENHINDPVFDGNTPIDFAARMITSTWSESSVTWNSKPSVDPEQIILDYRTATPDTAGYYLAFDITEAAIKWYNGTAANYGIEIRTLEQLSGYHYARFVTSENPNQYSSVLPMFKFSYRDNKGIEDYWTFHSASAADAGTVYVNDFTGNPVAITEIFSTPGNIMPISVGLVYNGYLAGKYFTNGNAVTADFSNMKLGAGFKLNVQETVVEKIVGNMTYYVHSDSDGTEHYYYNFDGGTTFYSEDGLGWKITSSGSNKILSDEKGDKKTFNSSGYLTKIEDANGNKQTYTYSSGKLTSIMSTPTGGTSSQTVTFSYSSDFLTRIYRGNDYYELSYSNTTPNRITKVSRKIYQNGSNSNGGHVSFNYSDNKLTCLYSESTGIRAKITYNNDNKAATIYQTVNTYIGQKTGFEYSIDKKTIIRTSGKDDIFNNSDDIFTTYVFDYYGRTVTAYTKDLDGNIVSASNAAYNTTTGKSKAVNGISKSGSVGANSINLVKDSSFESVNSLWNGLQTNGTCAVSTDYSFTGQKSAKLTVNGDSSSFACYDQSCSFTAGKTYTLSAYVKTSNVAGYGAYLSVNGITGNESMKLTGTTDTSIQNGWQRIYCTFTAPATQSYYIYLCLKGTSGTAYFDAVQLEEGSIGAYNLLENGAFINGSTGWTISGTALASTSTYAPYYSMWMTGNHSGSVTATQTVQLNMPVNTTYMLSAWAVGDSADTNVSAYIVNNTNIVDYDQKTRTFQVKATIYYYTSGGSLSSTTTVGYAKFNSDTNQLQYSITPVVPNASSVGSLAKQAYAIIEISYNNNVNTAQFLNISFTAEPAQTYSYDSQGNLSGVQNADGNKPAYTFASNSSDLENITNSDGSGYDINYDSKHQPTKITDANNVKAEYTYDSNGNITDVVVTPSSGSDSIITHTDYSSDGRFITKITDERGKETTYNYNSANGLLNYVNDANNNQTRYKYNIFKAITDVFADADKNGSYDSGDDVKVSYVYGNYRNLTQIVTETTAYNLTYDSFGNVSSITAGSSSTPLVSYTYADYNGKLTGTTYANGTCVQNVYDALDRTKEIKYNGTVRYSVTYDKSGSVSSIYDHENEIEYLYEYDRLGRLIRYYEAEDGVIRTVSAEQYDDKGRTSKVTYKNDGYDAANTSSYYYDSTGRLSMQYNSGGTSDSILYSYDSFGRNSYVSYYHNLIPKIIKGFSYYGFTDTNNVSRTTSLVQQVSYSLSSPVSYSYIYDNVGNIKSVNVNNDSSAAYVYDSLNQLEKESNFESGEIYRYYYDNGGNITSVKTYNGSLLLNTDTYSYTDTNWKDKLTAYNGITITYDALGNPLSYYNGSSYTFTWKDGRRLATLNTGSTSVSYKYNSDGIRYEKTVNGVVHKYYLMGSTITAETIYDGNPPTHIEYFYDSYGPYGFSIDGTFYYYIKNLQGDVTQIRDENCALIASYVYDAWGKVLSITENTAYNIGATNAIRYRGYYYDTESSLYYLNARYYDPQIKRFLNPDGILGANGGLVGYNMYSYCNNNPIIFVDYSGLAMCLNADVAIGGGRAESAELPNWLKYILTGLATLSGKELLLGCVLVSLPFILTGDTVKPEVKSETIAETTTKTTDIPIPPKNEIRNNYVYVLRNPVSYEVFYVGRTINPDARRAAHASDPNKCNLLFEIVLPNLTLDEARACEEQLIQSCTTLNKYNRMRNRIHSVRPGIFEEKYQAKAKQFIDDRLQNELLYWAGM